MNAGDDVDDNTDGNAKIVSLDKVNDRIRDKVKRKNQDARAEALATRFHHAMGWTPDTKKNGKARKKRKNKSR